MPVRTAVVTGGALGIGAAIARRLSADGCAVVIADTATDAGSSLAAELGNGARFIACDVREDAMLGHAINLAGSQLDVLVNNVGIDRQARPEALAMADWDALIAINLRSFWRAAQFAYPALAAAHGSIVNISSVQAIANEPGVAAYAATKAGVLGMTRGLAVDWAADGIRVNAVLPGAIVTPMQEAWLATKTDPAAVLAELDARIPMGRQGTPDDVASVVLFLASPGAAYVTGASVVVDGGLLARLAT